MIDKESGTSTTAMTPPVALVTGGAGGIGKEILIGLARRGFRIACIDSASPDDISVAVEEIVAATGADVFTQRADVRSVDACRSAVSAVLKEYTRLDVLINNVGINLRSNFLQTSEEEWRKIFDVNLFGHIRILNEAFPALREARGAVVNISSTAGAIAITDCAAYSVSKGAIIHLTKVLAHEWAQHDIRVNCVAPTIVETNMTADVISDEDYMRHKISTIPLHRMASPSDVANAVCWLVSSEASMVTGQTVFVDGGVVIT